MRNRGGTTRWVQGGADERLLLRAQQSYRDSGPRERVGDAGDVGHRAAHAGAEAEGRLEVEAVRDPTQRTRSVGLPCDAPRPQLPRGQGDSPGNEAGRHPHRRADHVPQAQGHGIAASHLQLAARSGHQEREEDEIVLEERQLVRRSGCDDRGRARASQGADPRPAQSGQVGERDGSSEAGPEGATGPVRQRRWRQDERRDRRRSGHAGGDGRQSITPSADPQEADASCGRVAP